MGLNTCYFTHMSGQKLSFSSLIACIYLSQIVFVVSNFHHFPESKVSVFKENHACGFFCSGADILFRHSLGAAACEWGGTHK